MNTRAWTFLSLGRAMTRHSSAGRFGVLLAILAAGLAPAATRAAEVICELTDPQHLSIPASLDILSARIEQSGGQLTFIIETRGEIPTSLPDPDDTQTYLWILDTDENPGTGQPHGPIGSEFNVRAVVGQTYGGGFVDVTGSQPGGGSGTMEIAGNRIQVRIWLSQINSAADFNWSCSSFSYIGGVYGEGNPDAPLVHSDTLPFTPPTHVAVTTPILELCPTGPATGQLAVLLRDADGNVLPNEGHVLTFHSTNEAVATVDEDGLVTALTVPEYHWETPYMEVWADGVMADNAAVVRVNSTDLEVIHQAYPGEHVSFSVVPLIEGVDLDAITTDYEIVEATDRAYEEEGLAIGTAPNGGGIGYFVLDVSNDPDTTPCGASGNPIRLGWLWGQPDNNSCYIINEPGHRVPQWFVFWHELGHNFTCSSYGFNQYYAGPSNPHNVSYCEGLASLAALWTWKAILTNPVGLGQTALDDIGAHFQNSDWGFRQALATYLGGGSDYEQLDPNVLDGILLEMFDAHGMKTWFDLYSTFLPPGDPLPVSLDTKEKQATWFVAAMSASCGQDLRGLFTGEYGFPIDQTAWPGILSAVQTRVAARTWVPPVAVDDPRGFVDAAPRMLPNTPNPFRVSTEIRFDLPSRDPVELTIYDVGGRQVATLVSGAMPEGTNTVVWDGRDRSGHAVASGTYLARLRTPAGLSERKVVRVR